MTEEQLIAVARKRVLQLEEDRKEKPFSIAVWQTLQLHKLASAIHDTQTAPWDVSKMVAEYILPEPIDPDLLEAREMVDAWEKGVVDMTDTVLAAIKRGRELAKEQDRG